MTFNSVRSNNQLLTWHTVNTCTERTLDIFIKRIPPSHVHLHLDHLRQELFAPQNLNVATSRTATKLLQALQKIKVTNLPYEKLTKAIAQRGIFPENTANWFIDNQPSKLNELNIALQRFQNEDLNERGIEDILNYIVDLIDEGQNLPVDSPYREVLLNALCIASEEYLCSLEMIATLLNEGLELPFAARRSLPLLLALYDSKMVQGHDLLGPIMTLVKQDCPLPNAPELSNCLFFLLCQHVSPDDDSLYPAIRKLIVQTENLDICDESQKNPFDHFLEKGGNLAQLFKELDLEVLEERTDHYLDTPVEEYEQQGVSWPGNVTLALYNPIIRSVWLQAENLDFLIRNTLIAFAQFTDATLHNEDWIEDINDSENHLKFLIEVLNKFNPIQLEEFMEALPERSKQRVKEAYCQNHGNFSDEKQFIKNNEPILREVRAQLELNGEQINALNDLSSFVSVEEPSLFRTAQAEKHVAENFTKQQILLTLTEIGKKLTQMATWVQDPRTEPAIKCIRQIIQDFTSINKENEVRQFMACAAVIGDGPLFKLKYKAAKKHVENYLKDGENLDDIDWDEVVAKVFQGKDLALPLCPGKESDDYRPWKCKVKQSLNRELKSCFVEANISTISDILLWLLPPSTLELPIISEKRSLEDDLNPLSPQPFSSPSKKRKTLLPNENEENDARHALDWPAN